MMLNQVRYLHLTGTKIFPDIDLLFPADNTLVISTLFDKGRYVCVFIYTL